MKGLIQLSYLFEIMRILQLHCDNIEYTPTKKEIKVAEEIENTETQRLEEVVVAFVAIEDGDDSSVAQNAISQIKIFYGKNWMQKITFVSLCSSKFKSCKTFNCNVITQRNGGQCI